MIKPMWFYKANYLASRVDGLHRHVRQPRRVVAGHGGARSGLCVRLFRNRKFQLPDAFMLVGMLTEYLPWVLVSRTMFIYHYFASVPFFVIAIVMYIRAVGGAKGAGGQERADCRLSSRLPRGR